MSDDERSVWKRWEVWDKLRYERDCLAYESQVGRTSRLDDNVNGNEGKLEELSPLSTKEALGDKKPAGSSTFHIPKKKKKRLSG